MRTLIYEESFGCNAASLFDVLLLPSAIRIWWGVAQAIVVPEVGGRYAVSWGDDEDAPDYVTITTIKALEAPRRLELTDHYYYGRTGPLPFEAFFEIVFDVEETGEGTTLRVTQTGFPAGSEADAFYSGCETGWRAVFSGIRTYLDSPS